MTNKPGFTPKELLLEIFDTKEKQYKEITRLDENEQIEYQEKLKALTDIHLQSSDADTVKKGEVLEDLVGFLLEKSSVFEVHKNLRTSTNEIDQLLILNAKGKVFQKEGILDLPGEHFLSECKNYQGKIGVTWIGKFYSLLDSTNTQFGLLFSYYGVTGQNWKDASGLIRKLYLKREDLKNKVYIININIDDFNSIFEGYSLLEIIDGKIKSLKFDTDLSRFIEKHPAEN